jgi:hypothetical protein
MPDCPPENFGYPSLYLSIHPNGFLKVFAPEVAAIFVRMLDAL